MHERAKQLLAWTQGEVAAPVKFDLYMTNKCNLLCQFCHYPFLPGYRYEDELSHDELVALVTQAGMMGAKVFGILGGEPFLRKKTTLRLMEIAKEHGMSGAIVTNGTLLNEDDLRHIITMKWDLLRLSIDGASAKMHDLHRGRDGSWELTIRTLQHLQSLKEELGSTHPTVEINTVLTRKNAEHLPDMIRLANENGVNRIYVLPVIEFGKDITELKIREEHVASILAHIDEAERVAKKLGVQSNLDVIREDDLFAKSNALDQVMLKRDSEKAAMKGRAAHQDLASQQDNVSSPSEEENREDSKNVDDDAQWQSIPCYFPWYSMSIDAQGWITPCGQIETDARINVRDFESLRAAWTSWYFDTLRKNMAHKKLPKGCERCCMPLMDDNNMLRENLRGHGFPGKEALVAPLITL